jgi:hypothetical protein
MRRSGNLRFLTRSSCQAGRGTDPLRELFRGGGPFSSLDWSGCKPLVAPHERLPLGV